MKIILDKADQLEEQEVRPVIIDISGDLRLTERLKKDGISSLEKHYDNQANLLLDAITNSLPRGTVDRFLVKLLIKKSSSYRGLL